MSFLMIFRIALKALGRNKMRTALTMLGMIIGVAAVITMVALGTGAQTSIEAQIQSAGTNMIIVIGRQLLAGRRAPGPGQRQHAASRTTAVAISQLPGVQYTAAGVEHARPDRRRQPELEHAGAGHRRRLPARSAPGRRRRAPSSRRRTSTTAAKVAVLGSVVRDQLFGPDADPIGQVIRITKQPFTVVGVMASKGQSGIGQDQDDVIFVPYTTVMKKLRGITFIQQRHGLGGVGRRRDATSPTASPTALRVRHKIQPGDPDDFMVRTMEEMASVRKEATQTMTALLASIAGVSLLVGGIGIMNIMLVSVTERTREIGLRMAIGARGRDVLLQFLVEAVVLSLFGGGIGIALGFGLAQGVTLWQGWPTAVSANAVAVAFGFAGDDRRIFRLLSGAQGGGAGSHRRLRFE